MKKRHLAAALFICLVTCGCGSPSGPGPAPTPARSSVLTLGLSSPAVFRWGGYAGYADGSRHVCGDIHVDWLFGESGGLGATITGSDVYVLHANGDITDRIVRTDGVTRVPALGTARATTDRYLCGWSGKPTLRLTCALNLCCPTQAGDSCGNDLPYTVRGSFTLVDEAGLSHSLSMSVPTAETGNTASR